MIPFSLCFNEDLGHRPVCGAAGKFPRKISVKSNKKDYLVIGGFF
jgi:hypothetical protein